MAYKYLLNKLATPATFILVGIVARILPHAPNFTPIGAMALFGGAYLTKKQALILPIAAMILSDFFIGFDSLPMRMVVYGSFFVMVLIGLGLKEKIGIKKLAISTLLASVLFFVTTNFAVWAFGTLYPKTVGGLIDCFILAIPFFQNTLLGDFFYTGVFFGGYNLVTGLAGKNNRVWNVSSRSR
jgi:hypothetical protein